MKRHCFTSYPLFALIGLMLSPLAVVHASPPFDYEQWRRDHPRPAGKRLADLDVGEPRTVRMIYFLPKGKSYSQEVVDGMKAVIGRVQTFYAEQMEAHGYGNLTFRFETDAQGEPIVHRVDGKHPSSYYTERPIDEISETFDLHRNVYFIIAENDLEWAGSGERFGKNGGYALLDEGSATTTRYPATTAHELGHAFGLHHDFRDDRYIMSYGYGDSDDRLSASAAEFLSVHPYFNPAIPIREGPPPSVELMSSQKYPAGSKSVSVRLQVRDPTGIHQVCLQTKAFIGLANEVTACRSVLGKKDAVVEFEYDGVIPSSTWWHGPRTSLSDPPVHEIQIMACDIEGNANGTTNDDARGWRYNLVEGSPYEIASLEGSSTSVHSLSFSPDGALLAFLNRGEVRLWDVAAQESVATLDEGQSVAFSPDGTLAVGSKNHTSLWNVANRQKIATLKGGGDLGVTFSLDGSLLASTTGSTVWLWDVATRTEVGTLAWHDGAYFYVNSLSFSPDGVLLASLYWKNRESDRRIRLWDVATQKSIATLDHGLTSPTSVVFSPDGTTLASGHFGWHRTVALWDVETWEQVAILEHRGSGSVESVAFSPDGRLLASAGGFLNNTVRLWDVQTRQELVAFGHTDPFYSLSFSPDGLLAAGSGETITLPDGGIAAVRSKGAIILYDVSEWTGSEPQARLTPDPSEVEFSANDPAWKTFTVHTNLDSVLVRANPPGSDPAIEVSGGQQVPTRDYCPAEGNDRPTSGRRDGWNLHVKACQAGQTKILLIDYDTDTVLQQYEVNVEASTSAAASTALNPNYPNPFNSETVLSYTLPTASAIRLEVFALNGQRVAVLHEGFQAAGYHTIALDASDLASGVYLYRLTTPEGRFTQKFTLLR